MRASAATPAGRAARRPERWTPPKCAFLAPTPAAPPPQSSYVDKKCPFTGNVSIRGRILKGIVISTKMRRTIIVRRDYLRYVPKYRRCARRPSSSARPRVFPGRRRSRARVPGLPPGSRVGPLLAPSSFEKRHRNVAAHCSPAFKVKEGDVATIGQCRCARRAAAPLPAPRAASRPPSAPSPARSRRPCASTCSRSRRRPWTARPRASSSACSKWPVFPLVVVPGHSRAAKQHHPNIRGRGPGQPRAPFPPGE